MGISIMELIRKYGSWEKLEKHFKDEEERIVKEKADMISTSERAEKVRDEEMKLRRNRFKEVIINFKIKCAFCGATINNASIGMIMRGKNLLVLGECNNPKCQNKVEYKENEKHSKNLTGGLLNYTFIPNPSAMPNYKKVNDVERHDEIPVF